MVTMTMREALRDAMAEEMRRDKDVFVMGEEVAEYQGAYKVTQGLLQEFGDKRVIDTPITEHGFAGLGVGAALAGLKPIVEFMTFNFAMQAMDQIINSAAKTLYMSGGQMGCSDRVPRPERRRRARRRPAQPGLFVLVLAHSRPQGDRAVERRRRQGPAQGRDPRSQSGDLPGKRNPLRPFLAGAQARRFRAADRQGARSRAPATTSPSSPGRWACPTRCKAAEELAKEGIDAEVIDLRTLKPMDTDTIVASVQKTGRCVTVEEGWAQSGVGAEIAARLMEHAFDYLDAPVLRVTGKDVPMPYAANLEKLALPSVAEVVEAAKAVCYR